MWTARPLQGVLEKKSDLVRERSYVRPVCADMSAGPDGFRDPLPNGLSGLVGHHPTRVLGIVGSPDQHLLPFSPAPVASRADQAWAGAVGR
jgi:hypothetical protein